MPHNAIVYFCDGAIFKGNIENYSFVGFGIFDYDVTIRGYYEPSYTNIDVGQEEKYIN